jgi:cytochrome oxidase Cu insertion factor (SCO1/SenC/PrrC family)
MKTLIISAAILGLATEALSAQGFRPGSPGSPYPQEFRLGAPVSDFTLRDTNDRSVNYSALKGNATAVIFFSTRCPMSNAFNYRRNQLFKDFSGRVKFIVVDSNSNESLEEVRDYARAVEFDFPVYKDINNVVADRFGAQVTTDTFVMDSTGVMRYHGYMEDSPNPTRAKNPALRLAIEAVLGGKPVTMPETHAFGCTIRRIKP